MAKQDNRIAESIEFSIFHRTGVPESKIKYEISSALAKNERKLWEIVS